jgi:Galactose oxidase, central domain
MTEPRVGHSATLIPDGTVLLAGGNSFIGGTFNPLASAEIYNSHSFSATGAMNTAPQSHTATLLQNGTVLIAGGSNTASLALDSAELYDPDTFIYSHRRPVRGA